jgi:aspartyl protease family protein
MKSNIWQPAPKQPRPSGGGWWLLALLATVVLIALLAWRFPDRLESERDWLHIIYLVGLLALVSSGVVASRRTNLRQTAKQAAAWIAIALIALAGYGYRFEIAEVGRRLLGELTPGYGVAIGEASVVFRVAEDGHFRVWANVDGVALKLLVDTGASDVVLNRSDALRLGYDPDALAYSRIYATANGMVRGAPVTLNEITVGPIRLSNVAASVNEAPMGGSVLGMSFLGRLGGFEISKGSLTMHQ